MRGEEWLFKSDKCMVSLMYYSFLKEVRETSEEKSKEVRGKKREAMMQ